MLSLVVRNLEVDMHREHLPWFEVPKGFTQSLHPILDSYLEINSPLISIFTFYFTICRFLFLVKTDLNN